MWSALIWKRATKEPQMHSRPIGYVCAEHGIKIEVGLGEKIMSFRGNSQQWAKLILHNWIKMCWNLSQPVLITADLRLRLIRSVNDKRRWWSRHHCLNEETRISVLYCHHVFIDVSSWFVASSHYNSWKENHNKVIHHTAPFHCRSQLSELRLPKGCRIKFVTSLSK